MSHHFWKMQPRDGEEFLYLQLACRQFHLGVYLLSILIGSINFCAVFEKKFDHLELAFRCCNLLKYEHVSYCGNGGSKHGTKSFRLAGNPQQSLVLLKKPFA
jgi:hypothetical protein